MSLIIINVLIPILNKANIYLHTYIYTCKCICIFKSFLTTTKFLIKKY